MPKFIPQIIMISGATGGIGSALAKTYAAPSKTLILTGRNANRLEEVANECKQKGANVIFKAFDITDSDQLSQWLEQLMAHMTIDLVIANAGMSTGQNSEGNFESLEATKNLLNVNILSVVNTIYPFIKPMQKQKRGQIAIMSSLAALRGLPHSPAYCASKAAIKIYGESLRALLRKDGVLVSIICPGFVKSAMSDKLTGPKPFLLSAAKAAHIVQKQLQKGKSKIIFPFRLSLALKILNSFPSRLADTLLVSVKSSVNEN